MVDNRTDQEKQAAAEEARRQQAANDAELRERSDMKGADPTGAREAHKDNPRPPRPAPGAQNVHPNVPGEGYRPNPANGTQDLPPERQAPRPEDPALIGTGRMSHTATPPEPTRQAGFGPAPAARPQGEQRPAAQNQGSGAAPAAGGAAGGQQSNENQK